MSHAIVRRAGFESALHKDFDFLRENTSTCHMVGHGC